jgi:hypothetical protein
MSQPPPLPIQSESRDTNSPTPVVPYQGIQPPSASAANQKVFDTVAGPNLRVRDNLIQLACVILGSAVGASFGSHLFPGGFAIGLVAGALASLLLSGLVIGIIRLVGAKRK